MANKRNTRVQLDISEQGRRNLQIFAALSGERSLGRALDEILTEHMNAVARRKFRGERGLVEIFSGSPHAQG